MTNIKAGLLLLALSAAAVPALADKDGVPHEGSHGIGRHEASVPEPASIALVAAGLLGLAIVRRRRK